MRNVLKPDRGRADRPRDPPSQQQLQSSVCPNFYVIPQFTTTPRVLILTDFGLFFLWGGGAQANTFGLSTHKTRLLFGGLDLSHGHHSSTFHGAMVGSEFWVVEDESLMKEHPVQLTVIRPIGKPRWRVGTRERETDSECETERRERERRRRRQRQSERVRDRETEIASERQRESARANERERERASERDKVCLDVDSGRI